MKKNNDHKLFFLEIIKDKDLNTFSKNSINQFQDINFHWIFSIIKLYFLFPPRNRTKTLYLAAIKDLLLPLESLKHEKNSDLYKIYRLRHIFNKVRLLSLVTLDSYYSHHPVRHQVSSAIMNLDYLFSNADTGFEKLLHETAGWLADELYMHPKAIAVLKDYEQSSAKKISKYKNSTFKNIEDFKVCLDNFMHGGFGQPQNDKLKIFSRFTFKNDLLQILGANNLYDLNIQLENDLGRSENIFISVSKNPFSNNIYIDIFYNKRNSQSSDIGILCQKTYQWILKLVEQSVAQELNKFPLSLELQHSVKEQLRGYFLELSIDNYFNNFNSLLKGTINYLLPNNTNGCVLEFIPSSKNDYAFDFVLKYSNNQYGSLNKKLENIIKNNPLGFDDDRIYEYKALQYTIQKSRALLIIACTEKFVIRDAFGRSRAEWDGVMLEILPDKAYLTIIEAKNKRSPQNITEAKKQLKTKSSSLLKESNSKLKTKIYEIPKFGAKLRVKLY